MSSSEIISSEKKAKVLLYLFGSLGDTLVAIPALRAVRRHFRDAELIVLQNIQSGNIVETRDVIPDDLVDGFLSYESKSNKFENIIDFYRLWRNLRRQNFQAAVYLVISERPSGSVSRDKFFFRACGIRRLIGFHPFTKEQLYPRDAQNRPAMTDNEAVRKLKRLQIDGVDVLLEEDLKPPLLEISISEIEKAKSWLAQRRVKADARLISIAPGCKTEANVWSVKNFIEIGRKLLATGNCELLIVGGKAEQGTGEIMVSAWGEGINAAGEFSVPESGAILSQCDFHIGLDTGTTHLAAMVGTPCFAIYGERNNPGHWYPLGGGHTVVFHPVECAGCRLQICPLINHPCMLGISVEFVWRHLQDFMQSKMFGGDSAAIKTIGV